MHAALIGHTGFVGGTLARARPFAASFNSANIADIRGRRFDLVVCAGVSAVKWLANKESARDRAAIDGLIGHLEQVTAGHFVLVSTIDVYRETAGRDERDAPPEDGLHPYGLHRLMLERFVAERFAAHSIVRLPALFGSGLKKNAVFDLMHANQTEKIVPNAAFQWYPLRRFADDLDRVRAAGIPLINITAAPVTMAAIRDRFFPGVPMAAALAAPPRYDLRSVHDALLGGTGGYHVSEAEMFAALAAFLAEPT